MSVLKLKNKDLEIAIKKNMALINFCTEWCGPCRMVAPIVEEIVNERTDLTVGKVNVDDSPEIAAKFGVDSIPTLIVFKDGKEIDRLVGFKPKGAILCAL